MSSPAVLSPHLDDAVLSCWNLIDRVEQASVITVFAGIPEPGTSTSWDTRCGQPDSQAMMRERIAENESALRYASARAINLTYLDGQYTDGERNVEEIAACIRESTEGDSTIYAPIAIAGLRKHPDHITVQQAARQLFEDGRDVVFYADLPYAIPLLGTRNWPARISAAKLSRSIGTKLEAETIELSEWRKVGKASALSEYGSQFTALSSIRRGLLAKDRFYRYEMLFKPV